MLRRLATWRSTWHPHPEWARWGWLGGEGYADLPRYPPPTNKTIQNKKYKKRNKCEKRNQELRTNKKRNVFALAGTSSLDPARPDRYSLTRLLAHPDALRAAWQIEFQWK